MRNYRLRKGMHVQLKGRVYRIEDRLPDRQLKLKDAVLENVMVLSEEAMLQALAEGSLELLGDSPAIGQPSTDDLPCDLSTLPDSLRQEARRRNAYVKAVMDHEPKVLNEEMLTPIIQAVHASIGDPKPPSWITLYRWIRRYQQADEDARALVPVIGRRGNRRPKLPIETLRIVEQSVNEGYLRPERPNAWQIVEMVRTRVHQENQFRDPCNQLPCPSYNSIYRYINALDPYEVTRARYGKHIADQKFMAVKQGPRPTRPLERVEMDHTKLDLFVIDPETKMPIGRPWLTAMIDVRTKIIVGIFISFEPPSYLSVMQCLRHAILPKGYVRKDFPEIKHDWTAYGLPELLVVDNGREFHSNDLADACLQLGIPIQYAPPRLAWYKPSVERQFGTLNRKLLNGKPGVTFSNIFEKSDYDPAANAVITFDGLMEMIHHWIIDVYHQDEHRGLQDVPQRIWDALIQEFPPALPSNVAQLTVLLGKTVERSLSAKGIELFGLFYNDDSLALLRRTRNSSGRCRVKVKFDPSDLTSVHVLDEINNRYIVVPAVNQEYVRGLSLWQHNVIRNYARQRVRDYVSMADLLEAKIRIQQIVDRDWNMSRKSGSRQRMARYKQYGLQTSGEFVEENEVSVSRQPPTEEPVSINGNTHAYSGVSDLGSAFPVPTESPGKERSGDTDTQVQGGSETSSVTTKVTFDEVAPRRRGRRVGSGKRSSMATNKVAVSETQQTEGSIGEQSDLAEQSAWAELDLTGYEGGYDLPKRRDEE